MTATSPDIRTSDSPARHRWILAILLLAAMTRGAFLVRNWNNLDFDASFLLHAEVARNILNGNGFQINEPYLNRYLDSCRALHTLIDPENFPPPKTETLTPLYNDEGGYGLLLACTWKIFGAKRWWYIRVIQVLLDILMCWLVFETGRRIFGDRAGMIAGILYALFFPGIEMAVRPHRDIWVTFLFITTVYFLVKDILRPVEEKKSIRVYIFIGAAAGLVTWMRSTPIAFVVFLAVILYFILPWRQAMRAGFALLLAFGIVLSPLIVRNEIVFGKFMATRGAFWHSFWAGVGQMPNPYSVRDDDETIIRFAHSIDSTAVYGTDAYEQVLKKKAVELFEQHPGWYFASVAKRGAVIVFPKLGRELFFQPVLAQHVSGILNRDVSGNVLVGVDALFGCLFLAGVWRMRSRWRLAVLLLVPFLYTLIFFAPFYVVGRTIANVYFTVFLFSASTLDDGMRSLSPFIRRRILRQS